MKEYTIVQIAYLAGIVDGEGSIYIGNFSCNPKTGTKNYQTNMEVTNTDENLINWLMENIGGRKNTYTPAQTPKNSPTSFLAALPPMSPCSPITSSASLTLNTLPSNQTKCLPLAIPGNSIYEVGEVLQPRKFILRNVAISVPCHCERSAAISFRSLVQRAIDLWSKLSA